MDPGSAICFSPRCARSKARTFGQVQERPPVSLEVRSGEKPAPDVLDSEREPRLTPAARRRLRLGIVVIIVSILAVAAGLEVQERRLAEARRLAGTWQLSASGPHGFGLEAEPPPSLSAVMVMTFSLRNDGPRDVTVTRASAEGFVLFAPVLLPAQTSREVVMRQDLDCGGDTLLPLQPSILRTTSVPLTWPGPLQVTVITPRGNPTIALAQPPYSTEHAAVMCDRLRSGRLEGLGGPAKTDLP